MAGIVTPAIEAPEKLKGASLNSETIVVSANKASTLINHPNKPTVNKLSGKKRILSNGTKIKLINIKAKAPTPKLFIPPV